MGRVAGWAPACKAAAATVMAAAATGAQPLAHCGTHLTDGLARHHLLNFIPCQLQAGQHQAAEAAARAGVGRRATGGKPAGKALVPAVLHERRSLRTIWHAGGRIVRSGACSGGGNGWAAGWGVGGGVGAVGFHAGLQGRQRGRGGGGCVVYGWGLAGKRGAA